MYEFNEWNVNFNILFVIQRRLKLRKKKKKKKKMVSQKINTYNSALSLEQ